MQAASSEKRQEIRYPLCRKVKYALPESSAEAFQGIVTNISNSGICLYLYSTLRKGESITFSDRLANSCQTAILHWINEMETGPSKLRGICLK